MTGVEIFEGYIRIFSALDAETKKLRVQYYYDRTISEAGIRPYYKQPILETSDSSVFLFLWVPEGKTRPHSHSGSEARIHVLYGTLRHEHFAIWDEDYELIDGENYPSLGRDADIDEPDNVVHRVLNPSLRWPALSLHLFVPPLNSMEVYEFAENKRWTVRGGEDTLGDPPCDAEPIWPS